LIFITAYCQINDDHCTANGNLLLKNEGETSWPRSLYNYAKLDYPKFHKMDMMAKMGTIGVEFLKLQNENLNRYADDSIALVFANKNSSANTDLKFQASYQERKSPSPSLFVYTLPNILLGEIAIKNKWYGENIFTISNQFDPAFFENYSKTLIPTKAQACICGWINVFKNSIDGFLFSLEQEDSTGLNLPLTTNNLLNLRKA